MRISVFISEAIAVYLALMVGTGEVSISKALNKIEKTTQTVFNSAMNKPSFIFIKKEFYSVKLKAKKTIAKIEKG